MGNLRVTVRAPKPKELNSTLRGYGIAAPMYKPWFEYHSRAAVGQAMTTEWHTNWEERAISSCGGCREHWKTVMQKIPLRAEASLEEQAHDAWARHDLVNKKLGKRRYSFEETQAVFPFVKETHITGGIGLISSVQFGGIESWILERKTRTQFSGLAIEQYGAPFDHELRKSIINGLPVVTKDSLIGCDEIWFCNAEVPDSFPAEKCVLWVHGACSYTANWLSRNYRDGMRVVCVSETSAEFVRQLGYAAAVDENKVDMSRLSAPDSFDRRIERLKLGWSDDDIVLGYHGRFCVRKGTPALDRKSVV